MLAAGRLNVVDGWSQLDCDAAEVVPVESSATACGWATAAAGWESSSSGGLYMDPIRRNVSRKLSAAVSKLIFGEYNIQQNKNCVQVFTGAKSG